MALTKPLLSVGVNVNVQEGCGTTPHTLAVLTKNKIRTCANYLNNVASISGHLFSNMPSPIEMAQAMGAEEHDLNYKCEGTIQRIFTILPWRNTWH